ncbi:MAG: amidase [Thermomicrobiales bacterium]
MTDASVDPLYLPLRELGERLRSGTMTATGLLDAAMGRLAITELAIHAHVEVLTDAARAQALAADDAFRAGQDLGPLQGIPIGVKDIFDVQGVPTRCGSLARRDAPAASTDADVVARLRRGGAVFTGKTVTQEFAAGVVSTPARNPWDPARIPGGSSGGSAAAVAVRSCLVALGSDTGGSIRIPASVTGTVGLKPTYGLVSKRGVFPLSWALDTVGPIARTVGDAAMTLAAMAGLDPDDPTTVEHPDTLPASAALDQGIAGLRVGVPRGFFTDRVLPDVADAYDATLSVFARLGAEVVEVTWDDAAAARGVAMVLNRVESAAVHAATVGRDGHLFGADLRDRLVSGQQIGAVDYIRALRAREVIRESIARLFATHRLDVLIAPTLPAPALPADDLVVRHDDGEEPVGLAYTRLCQPFNATGQPVLSLPMGFDRGGLPLGLQIAGRPFDEATVCRVGNAYERVAGWVNHRPPLVRGLRPDSLDVSAEAIGSG